MKLKLVYRRSTGTAADVIVTADSAAPVGDVARALIQTDPTLKGRRLEPGDVTLAVAPPGEPRSVVLPPGKPLSDAQIASGFTVNVVPSADMSSGRGQTVATFVVLEGPDAGREFGLHLGTTIVGRDATADIALSDEFVSKHHARIEVGSEIEMVDLNSANGVVVDGGVVSRLTLREGLTVTLGDSVVTIRRAGSVTAPASVTGIHGGAIPFTRSPRVETRHSERELPRPEVPSEVEDQPFPWLLMVAPMLMGIIMFVITGRPVTLVFVLMSPLMMLGNHIMSKRRASSTHEKAVVKFDGQIESLREELSSNVERERSAREQETPAVVDVYAAGIERGRLLWTRRPEHWSFLHLRLGTGTTKSRLSVAPAPGHDTGIPEYTKTLNELVDDFTNIDQVPLVESLLTAGALGVVGDDVSLPDATRALLIQVAGLHSPNEVVIAALTPSRMTPEYSWLKWLPHVASPSSPIAGPHLVDSEATAAVLLAELEGLIDARLGRESSALPEPRGPLSEEVSATFAGARAGDEVSDGELARPIVVVLIADGAPVDRARIIHLSERAAAAGIFPIWTASQVEKLPAVCRTYVDVSAGLSHSMVNFVRHGVVQGPALVDGVSLENAEKFALAIAPLSDDSMLVADSSDLPSSVSLITILGEGLAESHDEVVDRWRQNHSIHQRQGTPKPLPKNRSLRAFVGQAGSNSMHLDLRLQGPHALVGGTTGAGKSEFLQAWVLGMAAEYSPDRLTFLFVDYKGGAAFAECVNLPHCVGLVTDLSTYLVRRALTSLRAELHHREHLLNRKKAKDLIELETRGDPECPPVLVLVIDEFAALVGEVPEFVDGVVDIAQRGRSLGIHVIMATQRPAGVIKDNLRANTNLRIALRMADSSDSNDVVGTPEAAMFDPGLPGRALAKTGPGRLVLFQSGYAGGWTSEGEEQASVDIHELRFGAGSVWEPDVVELDPEPVDPGPNDQVRLVKSIVAAAQSAQIPAPRRPWLDDLATLYDLTLLGPRTDTELILGVADIPEQQAQETVTFKPDLDGNMGIFGTSGAGKSVLLRTLAAGAGITPRGGPVHVYALDFAAGGLRMIEGMPHVGAVVAGDDSERVVRLFRMLQDLTEERSRTFSAANAGDIVDYRINANRPDEPRILLLLDGFGAFRENWEVGAGRAVWYSAFQQLLKDGRGLGVHVVYTADRPASVPGAVAAATPKRAVLRMADEGTYLTLGVAGDVLGPTSPPGRMIYDDLETQIAIVGRTGTVSDQAASIEALSAQMRRFGVKNAPPVGALPTEIVLTDLPTRVDGLPLLGISDLDLQPMPFTPSGSILVAGGPQSGRSTALASMASALRRWDDDIYLIHIGTRRSTMPTLLEWDATAVTPQEIRELVDEHLPKIESESGERIAVFVESLNEVAVTPADTALVELFKAIKRSTHLVVVEAETSGWLSSYPVFAEIKGGRRGLILQPDSTDGDVLLRTPLPRVQRTEFPPGRGFWVEAGRTTRVQLPMM